MKYLLILLFSLLGTAANCETLFPNSVVSNDIDFIRVNDHTESSDLKFVGIERKEMPDRRTGELFDNSVFVFSAEYDDGTSLGIWASSKFINRGEAEGYVRKVLGPVGKLPSEMRDHISHIVIHKGNEGAFAEHIGRFFVLYSENILTRIDNNDLEETVFHESVHATLDYSYRDSPEWMRAQELDGNYITEYAMNNPKSEDLAETSLFVYTYLKHPERLPEYVREWMSTKIPNRIEFIRSVYSNRTR